MQDFITLVEQNTRTDEYVNATNWCKRFNRELNDFTRNKDVKAYVKALLVQGYGSEFNAESKASHSKGSTDVISKERVGRTTETWVHPLVAIKLAEWLSPDFEVYVKQIFYRYLKADESLAKDILTRAQGKQARKFFTAELQKRGAKVMTYAAATNAIYQPLFGMDASDLKETLDTTVTRDPMKRSELAAILLAESLAVDEMEDIDAKGHKALVECSKQAGERVARAFE